MPGHGAGQGIGAGRFSVPPEGPEEGFTEERVVHMTDEWVYVRHQEREMIIIQAKSNPS